MVIFWATLASVCTASMTEVAVGIRSGKGTLSLVSVRMTSWETYAHGGGRPVELAAGVSRYAMGAFFPLFVYMDSPGRQLAPERAPLSASAPSRRGASHPSYAVVCTRDTVGVSRYVYKISRRRVPAPSCKKITENYANT